ncbi:MAG: ImmA/IrrE family metallo-endopeptidase [Candidatus Omnitrophica bacterium]|nr:ImmA/IrrE family metallo-endopeptidase [Candidatus Omnitrophota bacterium]
MKHGFKSWCERASVSYRKSLALEAAAPLPPAKLAEYLNVVLTTPKDITGLSQQSQDLLTVKESSSWSAVTLSFGEKNIVIYNSSHATSRQSNDIMHELSHIILSHQPQQMHSYDLGMLLRHYNQEQEEEADWLAGVLLLPRDALIKIKFSKTDHDQAAKFYGASKRLLDWRLNATGVNSIYRKKTQFA